MSIEHGLESGLAFQKIPSIFSHCIPTFSSDPLPPMPPHPSIFASLNCSLINPTDPQLRKINVMVTI